MSGEEKVEPAIETWTFGGERVAAGGKQARAWLPGGESTSEELWYPHKRGDYPYVVGGQYEVRVERTSGRVSLYKDKTYVGLHESDSLRAELEAHDRAAKTRLRVAAMERNDKRKSALDDALEPLIALVRKSPGPDRDALIAYVVRKMSRA